MVSDTRSTRKSKNESDGNSSKKKVNTRKNSECSPGDANKTSTSRQMTPSPHSTRKSKRLDKEMPPVSVPVDRKSERLGKYNTPSPLGRSDRGKKELSSCSSGSKQSPKKRSPLDSKRKKEKPLIEVTMESKKAELEPEAVGMKRKKMDSRRFRSLFKVQRIQEIVRDGDEELDRSEKLSDVCSDHCGGIGSEQMEMVAELRDEGVDRAINGALQESISSFKGCLVDVENDFHVDSSLRNPVVKEPSSKCCPTSSSVGNVSDHPERLQTNCSTAEIMDDSGSSPSSARSQDGSVGSDSSDSSMHPEEAATTPPSMCGNCNLIGTCSLCCKYKRVGYDSPEQELCSCSHVVNEDRGCFICKDRGDLGAAFSSDSQTDGRHNVCSLCNKDGDLLCCVGKGCRKCYHLCCLDPSLTDTLPGVWHCPNCVKKKLLFGVHSVSEGVESIWDVREVEVSKFEGIKQKQYLVKYHGLAHIHNHWVPEKQLLLENPCILSNFVEKDQIVRWRAEWMVPHRLLRKIPMQEKIYIASSAVISVCENEWLVKWRGLDYDHATWELDNISFLSSSLGQDLMKDYEVSRHKAKKDNDELYTESDVKLPVLPANRSHVNVNYMLKNVNKLRECLCKCMNTVVFDDQERVMTVIYFIQSMSEICRPFLIVTTSGSLSQWEAEFAQLVPSLDVVVYSGSTDTRKGIRASEFYDEEGCVMVQVLLSSVEAISEDLEILRSIKWKAVVIDHCQHFGISNALEQIKMLLTDMRILLVSGQIKDSTSEYLKILSLIDPHPDFDKLRGLKPDTSDSLCILKERLSRFIAYGRASKVSKFIEYWIPVQISNYQLEQYCATLLSNSIPLCSYSRSDRVGALRDILLTVRKCCNHPYLLDSSVQQRLVTEQCPAIELLDIGIKASGKLQLLDMMLTEIKTRGLQVLILFELIMGSEKASAGDILDDFLRQRFGPNTYERIDAAVIPTKKQAAVNRFNKKETGQFVLLLENRACTSVIKLSSVDVVIIYDSDWNPANDLRALQKISIDSKVDQIKVFRLYSCLTIEERALVLSKQSLSLENNLQNFSRATSDALLSWGASYLFSKLDEYHADSRSNLTFNFSSEQSLLEKVAKDFQGILSENYVNNDSSSIISEAKLGDGNYRTNIPVLGEAKVQLKDGEEPHIFWKNLFDGKNPKWKHLKPPSPRNRKRVNYWEGSHRNSEIGKDDMVKKRNKKVNENLGPALAQVTSGDHQVTPDAVSRGGLSQDAHTASPRPSTIKASDQSENLQRDGHRFLDDEISVGAAAEERIVPSVEQKSLHNILQGEMMRLCQTLKLAEDVTHVVRKFLEYVIKNRSVSSDSPSIAQAFQISLCWVAASITKQKVDKKETFALAKQLLNYQCTEEQAHSVYSKMRDLKRMYVQSTDSFMEADRDCLLIEEDINREKSSNVNGEGSHFSSFKQKHVKLEENTVASEIDNKIKKVHRKCDKRMKKLIQKHQQEIQEFQQAWEKKWQEMEDDHKLELAFIRSMQYQDSVELNKLKLLEDKFKKQIEEHNLLKDAELKEIKVKQLAAVNEEKLKSAGWIAEAKACSTELRVINGQKLVNFQSDGDAESLQPSTSIDVIASRNLLPLPENPNKSSQRNDATPVTNSVTSNSQSEAGVTSPAVVDRLNQSKHFTDNGETVSAKLPAPVEQGSDDIRSVGPSEELPVPNEMVDHAHPGESSNAFNKESDKAEKIASSDDLVSQRGGTEEAANGGLHSTGQRSLASEQTIALPDCSQQVQQNETAQCLGSAQLQDLDAPAVENRSTLQIEVATSEPMESATDDIVTPVPSSHEDPVNDISKQQPSLVGAANQAPAAENHDGGTSSQAAEHGGAEFFCNESIALSEDNLNDVAMSQAEVITSEQVNQAVPQILVMDAVNLDQPINNVRATHQHTSLNLAPPILGDPLQRELERIRKEAEQLEKTRADTVSQLKMDCEKEIEEFISQIRMKFAVKLQETEAEFTSKRNELDKNQNKVLLNKILAEAVRSKCLELKPPGLRGAQQGGPSNVVLQQHQVPLPPQVRRSPGPLCSQPAHIQPTTASPSMQTPQQQPWLRPRSSPISIQSIAPPTITTQPVQQAAAHVSGPPSRPPVINAISPAGNPRGAGNRSIAPHLQPSRAAVALSHPPTTSQSPAQLQPVHMRPSQPSPLPRTPQQPLANLVTHASSTPPTTSRSAPQLQPLQMRPQPVQLPSQLRPLPRAPQQPSASVVSQDRAGLQVGVPAPPNPSPTTNGPSVPDRRIPSLPDISTTFSPLEQSDLEMLGSNVQGNQTSVASDVVCLSDD